ncbi:MAG: sodium-dependent bicarbonate transport family permease [Chlamydiales bacterium]
MFELFLENLASPPILFFLLGIFSVFLKVGIRIPTDISKILSLYLLIAIGFHGGYTLSHNGYAKSDIAFLMVGLAYAFLIPFFLFFILRTRFNVENSAAIAASYGSVSAVTFLTAISFLEMIGESGSGKVTPLVALMESPSIIAALLLAGMYLKDKQHLNFKHLIHESIFNPSVYVLLGSLLAGILSGERGWLVVKPFTQDIFKGVLMIYLLDSGIHGAQELRSLFRYGLFPFIFAIVVPILGGSIGVYSAYLLNLSAGDSLLYAALFAGASYIAVPAAMRLSLPKAEPSLYLSMSLGLTFPFNIGLGLPLYWYMIQALR